jgi:excisionase family DNA binding protein
MMERYYFTTNDIAQMCNVTRQTVINWIKNGKLKANLTPGGHRRVLREDLLAFFQKNQIDAAIIQDFEDKFRKKTPYCWEYFSMGFAGRSSAHECHGCPVKRAQAQRCFVIAPLRRETENLCHISCEQCSYYKRYGETLSEGLL